MDTLTFYSVGKAQMTRLMQNLQKTGAKVQGATYGTIVGETPFGPIEGEWGYNNGQLTLTVTSKPAFITTHTIDHQIRTGLAEAQRQIDEEASVQPIPVPTPQKTDKKAKQSGPELEPVQGK